MNINETLKHYFGYDSLRPGQQELIEGILQRKDVLGIMPTGAGKSLCYQVPALMLDGITIVVSPLISLMTDQVKALNQAGVHAAYINSSLTENQIRTALFYAAQGRYKIIYVAPERLNTIRFLEFACQVDISMVTVDEAHCISQWGQDFRPSYVGIADFLAQLPKRPVVSAFTATATERVKQDIMGSLRLQNPVTVVTGFDRPNLFFRVVTRKGGKETDNSVLNYVKKHEDESGIIYCATKKNADKIYGLLQQYGIEAGHYHAGLSLEERKKNQDDFTYDRIRVMVATNAFGMGIDKSNVRYVLHYNMPQSLEYYYQEAGRAGRDGEEAECVLFFSKQNNYKTNKDQVRIYDTQQLKKWWVKYPERYNPKGKALDEIWEFPIPVQGSWGTEYIRHFCPLPKEMVATMISISTDEEDVVFDPFAGSGAVMSQSAYMKRTYLGIEINPQYINMFEAYLKSTIESGKKEYYSYMNTMDQVAFETTIQNLRALKYGRILLNNIEKDYGINDLKIYVQRTESSISSKIKVEYTFIGRQLDDEFYRMISTYTNRPPLSKYGIIPTFKCGIDLSMLNIEIYMYSKTNSHSYLRDCNYMDSKVKIISPIKVDLYEKDFE